MLTVAVWPCALSANLSVYENINCDSGSMKTLVVTLVMMGFDAFEIGVLLSTQSAISYLQNRPFSQALLRLECDSLLFDSRCVSSIAPMSRTPVPCHEVYNQQLVAAEWWLCRSH